MPDSNVNKVVNNLMAIHPLLHKAFSRPMRNSCIFSPGVYYILGVLRYKGIQSMSEIGKKLAMPKPNVTNLVDKIIEKEWAERLSDENDRRIINIRITEKGIEKFLVLQKEISEELQRELMVLNEEEIIELGNSSEKIKELLRSMLKSE